MPKCRAIKLGLVWMFLDGVSATPRSLSDVHNSLRRRQTTQGGGRAFQYLDSEDIFHRVHELARLYPQFVKLESSQATYDLPAAGTDMDCPFESTNGCSNWILTIEDSISHSSNSSQHLPEVLLSGCLHGDERVGPTTVVETATLLLDAVACEAALQPSSSLYNSTTNCREILYQDWGIQVDDNTTRQWLARLVTTRRIVVVPTANALGYFRNVRTENFIDPNRDFPYDLNPNDPSQSYQTCMQTIAGRTLNEVFRDHMFQLSFTFHAGMEVIGYEWGAPSYAGMISPDDRAQNDLASHFSWYGGGFQDTFGRGGNTYEYGDMNSMVYPVRGGMEDWAYAASWDTTRTQPCTPSTFGGYDPNKTMYNKSTLRTFNMLVETSNMKTPNLAVLGTTQDLFSPAQQGNGHVSRNVRLSLLLIDMVQPYVKITSVQHVPRNSDVVPSDESYQMLDSCWNATTISIDTLSQSTNEITLEWNIGGAFQVDETSLVYGKKSDFQGLLSDSFCTVQPTNEEWAAIASAIADPNNSIQQSKVQMDGVTRWSSKDTNAGLPQDPVYFATIDLDGDDIVAYAIATVDSSWSESPDASFPPQSHVVNARTNPSWFHESAGKVIQGRTVWVSLPVVIQMIDSPGQDTAEPSAGQNVVKPSAESTQKIDTSFLGGNSPVEGPQLVSPQVQSVSADTNSGSFMAPSLLLYTAFFAGHLLTVFC